MLLSATLLSKIQVSQHQNNVACPLVCDSRKKACWVNALQTSSKNRNPRLDAIQLTSSYPKAVGITNELPDYPVLPDQTLNLSFKGVDNLVFIL